MKHSPSQVKILNNHIFIYPAAESYIKENEHCEKYNESYREEEREKERK